MMDHRALPDLVVLLEAVRCGSLTAAARNLHTVQSNVTARIRLLERNLGVRLLERHARGVRPTAAGEAAVAIAERAAELVEELRTTFAGARGARPQKLRLGAIETVVAGQLPALVDAFQRMHPNVEITVRADGSARLIRGVKEGELDAAFVSRAPQLAGLRGCVAFRDRLALLAPRDTRSLAAILSPGAGAKPVKVLVQRLDCSYTKRLTTLLERHGRRYRLLDLGTLEGVLKFVELGAGIAAMPRAFVQALGASRTARHKLLPLPRDIAGLELFLVAAAENQASAITNRFVAFAGGQDAPAR